MLKVKNNLDLKELEKFGFETDNWYYTKSYDFDYYEIIIKIDEKKRTIQIKNDYYDADFTCDIPNVIYDLIKADLVEKVDNNNGK